jgi:hypothetical protein
MAYVRTSDGGATWSAPTAIRPCDDGEDFSVCFSGATVYYAMANGTKIRYRYGNVAAADGHIVWATPETDISTIVDAARYPTVGVGSDGFVYVAYTEHPGFGIGPRCYVVRSAYAQPVWGATAPGFPYAISAADIISWRCQLVPLTRGKMLFAYAKESAAAPLYFRRYLPSGVWGAQAQSPTNVENPRYWNAVADGDDAYAVYLEDASLDIESVKYTYSPNAVTSTGVVHAAASATSSPILGRNQGTGDLYAVWAGDPAATHVYYSTYSGATWSAPVDWLVDALLVGNNRITSSQRNLGGKIQIVHLNGAMAPYLIKHTYLWVDEISVTALGATQSRVPVGTSVTLYASAELREQGGALGAGDSLSIEATPLAWNAPANRWEAAVTRNDAGTVTYDTYTSGLESVTGITSGDLNGLSAIVEWYVPEVPAGGGGEGGGGVAPSPGGLIPELPPNPALPEPVQPLVQRYGSVGIIVLFALPFLMREKTRKRRAGDSLRRAVRR